MQTSAAVDSRFWVECSLDSVATLFSFCAVKIKIVSKCPVLKLYIALLLLSAHELRSADYTTQEQEKGLLF